MNETRESMLRSTFGVEVDWVPRMFTLIRKTYGLSDQLPVHSGLQTPRCGPLLRAQAKSRKILLGSFSFYPFSLSPCTLNPLCTFFCLTGRYEMESRFLGFKVHMRSLHPILAMRRRLRRPKTSKYWTASANKSHVSQKEPSALRHGARNLLI